MSRHVHHDSPPAQPMTKAWATTSSSSNLGGGYRDSGSDSARSGMTMSAEHSPFPHNAHQNIDPIASTSSNIGPIRPRDNSNPSSYSPYPKVTEHPRSERQRSMPHDELDGSTSGRPSWASHSGMGSPGAGPIASTSNLGGDPRSTMGMGYNTAAPLNNNQIYAALGNVEPLEGDFEGSPADVERVHTTLQLGPQGEKKKRAAKQAKTGMRIRKGSYACQRCRSDKPGMMYNEIGCAYNPSWTGSKCIPCTALGEPCKGWKSRDGVVIFPEDPPRSRRRDGGGNSGRADRNGSGSGQGNGSGSAGAVMEGILGSEGGILAGAGAGGQNWASTRSDARQGSPMSVSSVDRQANPPYAQSDLENMGLEEIRSQSDELARLQRRLERETTLRGQERERYQQQSDAHAALWSQALAAAGNAGSSSGSASTSSSSVTLDSLSPIVTRLKDQSDNLKAILHMPVVRNVLRERNLSEFVLEQMDELDKELGTLVAVAAPGGTGGTSGGGRGGASGSASNGGGGPPARLVFHPLDDSDRPGGGAAAAKPEMDR